MPQREVLDRSQTPDGQELVLTREPSGDYLLRVGRLPLMSSATYGSEQAMAGVAREVLGEGSAKVLVGGLGMGFTARAVLDEFGKVTVAELLPAVVRYNREVFGHLAGDVLDDPGLELVEGDVRGAIDRGGWNAILLDVDQGPDAVTTRGNESLYSRRGIERLKRALAPGGVLIIWSAYESPEFEQKLTRGGFRVKRRQVFARAPLRKGARHVLFVARG